MTASIIAVMLAIEAGLGGPQVPQSVLDRAQAAVQGRRFGEAELLLTQALTASPADATTAEDRVPLSLLLGQVYSATGRFDLALAQFDAVIRAHPNLPHAHYQAGIAHTLAG